MVPKISSWRQRLLWVPRLENCATEPEVVDLANMLAAMGAKISGIGTTTMVIEGVESLHGCEYSVIADRIETGSYLAGAPHEPW